MTTHTKQESGLPWHVVETAICKEKTWLDTVAKIENNYLAEGFTVEREPNMHYGSVPLFVEVGTTSLFKLSVNLRTMSNFMYLVVPNDEQLIEFRKNDG